MNKTVTAVLVTSSPANNQAQLYPLAPKLAQVQAVWLSIIANFKT